MAETDTPNPILAMIDKAVEEKTFGLDALTAVQKIKEQAAKLDKDLTYSRQSLEQQKRETERAESGQRVAVEKVKQWEAREAAVAAREAKVTELEKQTAVAQAQSGAYFTVLDRMFANRQFRETVMENAMKPVPMPGGYTNSASETRTVTTDRSDLK
jgi:hypothetical protein